MKPTKVFLLFFYLIISSSAISAQSSVEDFKTKFSVDELKEDFRILRHNIEATDAGLYTYTNKEVMDSAFDDVESSISEPMTSIDLFRRISPLLKLIGNAHTNFSPSKGYADAIEDTLLLFPFEIYWDHNKLFILKNSSSNNAIEEGSVISSINGELAEDVFNQFVNSLRTDGYNSTGPEAFVNRKFRLYYAHFKGTPSSFNLEIISPNGTSSKVEIPAVSLDGIEKNNIERYNDDGKDWLETKEPVLLLDINGEVATMTIKTFSNHHMKNSKQRFKKYLKKS